MGWLWFMVSELLRVGVVGLGKMGLLHAGVLSVLPGVEVAAVCEKSRLLRRFVGKVFRDVRVVDDVEGLAGCGLDAVFVTTPIRSHFRVVKAVCEGDVASSVFVEKTLASSYDEARRLCGLLEGSGGVNMVGYVRRFGVTFRKAKELLGDGLLGDVKSFEGYAFSSDFFGCEEGSGGGRGGVLRDLGCHAVDLALWFFGDLRVESAEISSLADGGGVDMARFGVHGADGLTGKFDVSWCKEGYRMPEVGFKVTGSEGELQVNDDRVSVKLGGEPPRRWMRHDLDDHVFFWLGAPEYYREDQCFVDGVLGAGGGVEPCFEEASRVDRVIDVVEEEGC